MLPAAFSPGAPRTLSLFLIVAVDISIREIDIGIREVLRLGFQKFGFRQVSRMQP